MVSTTRPIVINSVLCTSLTAACTATVESPTVVTWTEGGSRSRSAGSAALPPFTTSTALAPGWGGAATRLGAGLEVHVDRHALPVIVPGAHRDVLAAVDSASDVADPHRRAVAVSDDGCVCIRRGAELMVCVQRHGTLPAIKGAFRAVGGGDPESRADVFKAQAHGCDLHRIKLDPNRRFR